MNRYEKCFLALYSALALPAGALLMLAPNYAAQGALAAFSAVYALVLIAFAPTI
jgi:VIT1/CCC1 family predicted Fe2+/Mn2+ transporter